MHWKIVLVFSLIVVLVGGTARLLLGSAAAAQPAPSAAALVLSRNVHTALLQFARDQQSAEAWLAEQSTQPAVVSVFARGTSAARSAAATEVANHLVLTAAALARGQWSHGASLVVLVDERGVVLGRNGGSLMRGESLATPYPILESWLASGRGGSAIWVSAERQEQFVVSMVPVRNADGRVVGGLVLGWPVNDELLANTSALTSGGRLLMLERTGDERRQLAVHQIPTGRTLDLLLSGAESPGVAAAQPSGMTRELRVVRGANSTLCGGSAIDSLHLELWSCVTERALTPPMGSGLGLSVLVGLLLTAVAGVSVGNYIMRPISALEDGLLQVINGAHELRFELAHAELGGLVSRINSVLDALTGPAEPSADTSLDDPE